MLSLRLKTTASSITVVDIIRIGGPSFTTYEEEVKAGSTLTQQLDQVNLFLHFSLTSPSRKIQEAWLANPTRKEKATKQEILT